MVSGRSDGTDLHHTYCSDCACWDSASDLIMKYGGYCGCDIEEKVREAGWEIRTFSGSNSFKATRTGCDSVLFSVEDFDYDGKIGTPIWSCGRLVVTTTVKE